jgi:hypothetical protein
MRFLYPETLQAHITGFQDEPAFYPGTNAIESVSITASLEVKVSGKYSLEIDLAGLKERTEAELSVGTAKLSVSYPVARIRELRSGGPFRILNARLLHS